MNQNDIRVKKSKDALKFALLQLLVEKKLDEITVKELCDVANIQRGTFYRHYTNIAELYEKILNEDLVEIKNFILTCHSSSLKVSDIRNILNFIKEKNTFLFTVYMKPTNFDNYNNDLMNLCLNGMAETLNTSLTDPECFNTISFMYAGIYEYITQWIKSDYALSVDDVAQHIYTLLKALTYTLPDE